MTSEVLKIRSLSGSLLRYPGGKGRHAKILASLFKLNKLQPKTFIEPFCGGASISLNLLEADAVETISLNDLDPMIASLWKAVFSTSDSKWLSEQVMTAPLTLEYWDYQKSIIPQTLRERAFQCLYLNRTSFSGLLHKHAGPIGGRKQDRWTIGCRFNREKLAARIEKLSSYANRVNFIENKPWRNFISQSITSSCFLYFDPPYYNKADRLYRYVFDENEHVVLHDYLLNFCDIPWVLSYDDSKIIRDMYLSGKQVNGCIIDSTYSTHPIGGNSFIGRELLLTNLKALPEFDTNYHHRGISIRDFDAKSSKFLISHNVQPNE